MNSVKYFFFIAFSSSFKGYADNSFINALSGCFCSGSFTSSFTFPFNHKIAVTICLHILLEGQLHLLSAKGSFIVHFSSPTLTVISLSPYSAEISAVSMSLYALFTVPLFVKPVKYSSSADFMAFINSPTMSLLSAYHFSYIIPKLLRCHCSHKCPHISQFLS